VYLRDDEPCNNVGSQPLKWLDDEIEGRQARTEVKEKYDLCWLACGCRNENYLRR